MLPPLPSSSRDASAQHASNKAIKRTARNAHCTFRILLPCLKIEFLCYFACAINHLAVSARMICIYFVAQFVAHTRYCKMQKQESNPSKLTAFAFGKCELSPRMKSLILYLLQHARSTRMRVMRCVRNEINKKKRVYGATERETAYFLNAAAMAARVASASGPATGAQEGACVSKRVISSGPAARISSAANSNNGERGRPKEGQRENRMKIIIIKRSTRR